ncbi:MAG: hypothetical protein WKF59_03325 [Chitinophagaceae bacterium]
MKPSKWWTTTLFAEVQDRSYNGIVYDYSLDTSSVYFGTNMTNQFTLRREGGLQN